MPFTVNLSNAAIGIATNSKTAVLKLSNGLTADTLLNAFINATNKSFSYMSLWDPTGQLYIGHPASKLLGVKLKDFPLQVGHAYFIDVPEDANITLFGKLPGPVSYELKWQPWGSHNYIILPLNTSLKWASDLCNNGNLSGKLDRIGWWDEENQTHSDWIRKCSEIIPHFPGYDFKLQPGKSYRLIISQNTTWKQT